MRALQSSGALPRELVLASAGSGKTYHLSSRILGLLAAGAAPGEILASTFTRKAAGEILERVLLRMARGVGDAEEARQMGKDAHARLGDPAECRRLLGEVLDQLHQMNIGTLDAFFGRVARMYFQELGLAPGWSIGDAPTEERIRTEAVLGALAAHDPKRIAERIRLLNLGGAARSAHDDLSKKLDELIRLRRQADPDAPDVWSPAFEVEGSGDPEEIAREAAELAARIRELPVPLKKDNTPVSSWVKARETAATRVESGAWADLYDGGIGGKILEGADKFDRRPIEGEWIEAFDEARLLGRRALAGRYRRQVEAMGELAELLEEAFEGAQRRAGAYRFEDITHLLGGPEGVGASADLHYRLDQQVRHLLLDEFQDTSLPQWQALEPLAGELLSGHLDERAGVIVADPKQSIYGWRGARPELVHAVGRDFGLTEASLDRSWRSGKPMLDFVDEVFRSLDANEVVGELDPGGTVARAWLKDFTTLEPGRTDQPGHVRIHVAPGGTGKGDIQPEILTAAADLIQELHEAMPERTIGVLVRKNKVLAHLMAELGKRGVAASGEGGSPLTDTPPVNAILSLLHLADHPQDTVARYHVAMTPLGAAVEFADWRDASAARRLSGRVRRALARDGYGPTLAGWVAGVAGRCERREVERLLQLVELGHRWDERSTLRPGDFIRYVGTEVVEDPSAARVQVMTVHKAKGLQFDVVVLPELQYSMADKGRGIAVPLRDPSTGRVTKVYPGLSQKLLPYFPEVEEARAQARAADLRDGLSVLYVALTRARYALHLVVPPAGGTAKSPARLIRHALGITEPESVPEAIPDRGDPEWHTKAPVEETAGDERPARPLRDPAAPLLTPSPARPGRNLARRSPSSLEGGPRVDLRLVLRLDNARARERGDVVHAWCEKVPWVDNGIPDDAALVALAREKAPRMPPAEVAALIRDFRTWMGREPIQAAMSRSAYPTDADVTVRVETERPFARRKGDEIQEGSIDRLVLIERGGRVVEAHVLDFKTDAMAPGDDAVVEERTRHYRPQLEAYREVIREQYGLEGEAVRGTLVFLAGGRVVGV
ncbi:MAG TPA: UvrD-helicase domain-containing protein [Longimicrobiales bacterium]|nr:UvrD-helicase domain-containing protein [Longimicrobiales bacterium]